MLKTRLIPCLLLHEGGLVKTVKFKSPKYVGDPINAVKIFNDKEVDELVFLDIDASKEKRSPDLDMIKDLASECFMPFAYGGGISTLDQIRAILNIGVEKVVLNHHALHNSDLIGEAAEYFGSSTIIGAIDVKKDFWGHYKVFDHSLGKVTAHNPVEYAQLLQRAGVGEIFLNNVDRDGTYQGLDKELISRISAVLSVPLIACGGTSDLMDIQKTVKETKIGAVAAGSIFVYQGPHKAVLLSYPTAQQLEQWFD